MPRFRLDPAQVSVEDSDKAGATYSKEDKDVTLGLRRVNLEYSGDGGVQIVGFGLRSVVDVDGITSTGDCVYVSE